MVPQKSFPKNRWSGVTDICGSCVTFFLCNLRKKALSLAGKSWPPELPAAVSEGQSHWRAVIHRFVCGLYHGQNIYMILQPFCRICELDDFSSGSGEFISKNDLISPGLWSASHAI